MSYQKCDEDCRLYGIYRGRVVKHLENGILKVYIPDIYPIEWAQCPDKLPDAELAVPIFGGNNNGNGVFSYPNIGTYVICQFLNGDQNLPIVIGATQGGSLASMKWHEAANELDPATGKEPAYIHMISVGRTKVKIYEGGYVEIQIVGKTGKASKVTLDQNGGVFFNCDGTFQVQADNIKLVAKDQFGAVGGKSAIVVGGDVAGISGKDVAALAPKGVIAAQSKYRLTGI